MTEPLAFLLYESLLPGSQLTNRLRDLGYRVKQVTDVAAFEDQVVAEKPLLAIVELASNQGSVCDLIARVRQNSETLHLPVLAYTSSKDKTVLEAARAAGATLIVVADGLLPQLPMLLERVLEVE